jgi:DNA-directed RNA polymerase sigma subunit (sigma70/sigma32)
VGWRGFIVVKPTTRFRANKMKKAAEEFEDKNGRPPAASELAELTGESEKRVQRLLLTSDLSCVSLEQICEEGHEIPAASTRRIQEDIEHMKWCMDRLPLRDREVLGMRFGVGNKRHLTLKQLGNRLNLSSERVRQLEDRALVKLRKLFHHENWNEDVINEMAEEAQ